MAINKGFFRDKLVCYNKGIKRLSTYFFMKAVSIYTTPTCHFCKEAKTFFNENNVKYNEYDVQSDLETGSGQEKIIREKFGVAKDGEGVVVLYEPEEGASSEVKGESGFWQNIKRWFNMF